MVVLFMIKLESSLSWSKMFEIYKNFKKQNALWEWMKGVAVLWEVQAVVVIRLLSRSDWSFKSGDWSFTLNN